jgi:hypothetical protein
MPAHHGLGLHKHEAGSPILPQLRQENPEEAVGPAELWALHAPLKYEELMAEGDDLKKELGTVPAEVPQEGKKKAEEGHRWLPE